MDPALEIFSMDGLILTRKPPLVTSHDVVKQIPLIIEVQEYNAAYLNAKADRLGHQLKKTN